MPRRSLRIVLAAALAVACSQGGSSGCLAEIPGGFPAEQRKAGAVTVKVTRSGLQLVEQRVNEIVGTLAGAQQMDLPCTDASQTFSYQPVPGLPPVQATVNIYACDLNGDFQCSAADDDPAARADEPGHGTLCRLNASVVSMSIAPTQAADGTVDVGLTAHMRINTGRIPMHIRAPVICNELTCSLEYDSDAAPAPDPTELPVTVHLQLKLDSASGDLLAFEIRGIEGIGRNITPSEWVVGVESGSCRFGLGCDILNNETVKGLVFQNLERVLEGQIHDALDGFRCLACSAGAEPCPAGSACHADSNLCYRDYDKRDCVPAKLGVEGRADVHALLGGLGAPENAALDVSVLAGGRDAAGAPATRVQTGGLVLGMLGGTRAPQPAACVRGRPFGQRPVPAAVDFDAEAAATPPGGRPVADYKLGLALSDGFLDKTFFDAWLAGALCLDIDSDTTSYVSSGVFATFLPSIKLLTDGENVPMLIALRPQQAPSVTIGRGTTREENGSRVPDDPLLTLQMNDLQIDFHALVDERQARLFSLVADVALPLSLEFDPVANTVQPALASLDTAITNVRPANSEMLAEDPADLGNLVGAIIGMAQPALAGAIQPIALPATEGVTVRILDARGAVAQPAGQPGYQHLALFADLDFRLAQPSVAAAETYATLVETRVVQTSPGIMGPPKS